MVWSGLQGPALGNPGAGELLQLMLDGVPRTRAELIKVTGLGRSTIGSRVDALLAAGLLVPSGEAVSTGGRPPATLAFNPDAGVVVAADVGATHALVTLTNLRGRVFCENLIAVDVTRGPELVLDQVAAEVQSLLRAADRAQDDLVGIGIGLPGPVEHSTGRPVRPPIMPGWHDYDVPGHLEATVGRAVLVDNDVNLMALGEHATFYPEVPHLMYVKVATGIGSGIITNGSLNRGALGCAGDLGHVAAPHGQDAACTCGNVGCLEAVASGPAIIRRLRESGIEIADTASLITRAKRGDPQVITAIREAGREIGRVLATAVSLLNPSVIVVGGIMASTSGHLLAGIREIVYGRSLPLATGELRIVASRAGAHAGVIGAATMVTQHVLSGGGIRRQPSKAG